ncbi:hypothetical protein MKX01_012804 [Papaver californicum]|nr:hypothetical protein MKX01_012804 [Papaver californicum]
MIEQLWRCMSIVISVADTELLGRTIIKTIKGDNEEIIDCYDIYKQPAFRNPLFQNHTIQSSDLGRMNLTQPWHKYGTCPERTIPIIRSRNISSLKTMLPHRHFSDNGHVQAWKNDQEVQNPVEKPLTEPGELSTSQIWVTSHDAVEAIEAGWQVNPSMYGDNEPRFFVAWTADNYQSTGCYDIDCTGFVQTSSTISLGAGFTASVFNGSQCDATFSIFQEQSTGNWWVQLEGVDVGYWPPFLFKQLSTKATTADFGGVISNTGNQGRHTSTDMGSGHLPSEGNLGVSSYFQQVKVIDGNHTPKDPVTAVIYQINPNCYGLYLDHQHLNGYGFYYGGPGFSCNCQ